MTPRVDPKADMQETRSAATHQRRVTLRFMVPRIRCQLGRAASEIRLRTQDPGPGPRERAQGRTCERLLPQHVPEQRLKVDHQRLVRT